MAADAGGHRTDIGADSTAGYVEGDKCMEGMETKRVAANVVGSNMANGAGAQEGEVEGVGRKWYEAGLGGAREQQTRRASQAFEQQERMGSQAVEVAREAAEAA